MNIIYLFTCLCHFQFLSSLSYNFPNTGLLPSYLGLFLDILLLSFSFTKKWKFVVSRGNKIVNNHEVLVTQSCPTVCDPVDCSSPESSIHGILQTRIPEWVAIPFCRRSSWPRDSTWVSCIPDGLLTIWATSWIPVKPKESPDYKILNL